MKVTLNTELCRSGYILGRQAGHVCSIDKKGHFLVNLGKFDHETPLNGMKS